MRVRLCFIVLIVVTFCGGAIGCGSPEPPDDLFQRYQQLSADHTALQNTHNVLQHNYKQLKDSQKVEGDSQEKYNALANQYRTLQISYAALEAQTNTMNAYYEEIFNAIAPDQAENKEALRIMNEQYLAALARAVACNPRDFATLEELTDWRLEQKDFGKNTVANCRVMQKEAWKSGFILSVRLATKDCIAFVGKDIYRVYPSYDKDKEDEEEFVCVWKVK